MGAIMALLCGMFVVFGSATRSEAAAPSCPPGQLYVNTGGGGAQLMRYSDQGTLLGAVPLVRSYGDIAFLGDGSVLYGIGFGADMTLYKIDRTTGAETGSVAVTGIPVGALNSLSALPDGRLIVGSYLSNQVWTVDPATGVATLFPSAFPDGFISAGDFLRLSDGDLLAVASGGGRDGSTLFRFHPDGTVTQVGQIALTWGAAQSGGKIFLATPAGSILQLGSIPQGPSSDPVPVDATIVQTDQQFWGATSQQDSGLCSQLSVTKTSDPASGSSVRSGQIVSYSIVFTNASTATAPAILDHTDDLNDILDDATIVSAPAVASGSPLTVGPVVNGKFSVTGVLPIGASATVTYSVIVLSPDTGDHSLTNFVIPTGTPVPDTCPPELTTCTVHPVADLTVIKSASSTSPYTLGQSIVYTFVATNTGAAPLSDVSIRETAFTGSGTMGALTPRSVPTLAPGDSATFTANYTVTQDDVDRGTTTNAAVAFGTPPSGGPLDSPPSTVSLASTQAPALALVKSADVAKIVAANQTVTYNFRVTNTGNVTVEKISVHETAFSGTGTVGEVDCGSNNVSLAPGESVDCKTTYVVTSTDLASGRLINTAVATGSTRTGEISSAPSSVDIPAAPSAPTPTRAPASPNALATTGTSAPLGVLYVGLAMLVVGGATFLRVNSRRTHGRNK